MAICPTVVSIGASIADIKALPNQFIALGSSASGQVYASAGGVARGMAENLSRLGITTHLLSAIGSDILGEYISHNTHAAGVYIDHIIISDHYPTAMYVSLLDKGAITQYAVFDNRIITLLSADYIINNRDILNTANLIIADANLHEDTISQVVDICYKSNVYLYFNLTSCELAHRALAFADKISMLAGNDREVEALLNTKVETVGQALQATRQIINLGVQEVIVTLGPTGVVYQNRETHYHLPALHVTPVDTTGAGDALSSGFLYGRLSGFDVYRSLQYGLAAATLTIGIRQTVHPELSPKLLAEYVQQKFI